MTQEQEKAKQLVEEYYLLCTELNPMAWEKVRKSYAKQCAIICVNEMEDLLQEILTPLQYHDQLNRLESIKTEIKKL